MAIIRVMPFKVTGRILVSKSPGWQNEEFDILPCDLCSPNGSDFIHMLLLLDDGAAGHVPLMVALIYDEYWAVRAIAPEQYKGWIGNMVSLQSWCYLFDSCFSNEAIRIVVNLIQPTHVKTQLSKNLREYFLPKAAQ